MISSSNRVSPDIARQILNDAKLSGVSVEDYLSDIAEDGSENGQKTSSEIRRIETKVDLSQSKEWLKENRHKYLGKWVVLDGKNLIGTGEDPRPLVEKARAEGVKVPFVKFIEPETEPFTGGWL